ncbi:MAG TPA: cytochrome C oxidase subunit IV family protein [Bryobacteraceae bacterium]|nr:cytochrome C oxidase subunit IV family protein [Bryobacteraceae bacterium]
MSTRNEHAIDPKREARNYALNLTALLILTLITVGASYIDFGQGNIVIALAIATVKATLVALFFMHLAHDRPVNGLIAVAGFIFLGLFLLFDFLDVTSRRDPNPQNLAPTVVQTAPPAGAPAAQTAAPAAPAAAPAGGAKKE